MTENANRHFIAVRCAMKAGRSSVMKHRGGRLKNCFSWAERLEVELAGVGVGDVFQYIC